MYILHCTPMSLCLFVQCLCVSLSTHGHGYTHTHGGHTVIHSVFDYIPALFDIPEHKAKW